MTWEDLLEKEQMARAAVICTQDQMHVDPTLKALERGYDVLLEKPMATTIQDCIKLVKKTEEVNRQLQICHVLRYTTFWSTIKSFIESGQLGDVISITHRENVSYWHQAHSYVRGNWRNSEVSSPMILAKCCHDLDLLYWIVGAKPRKIASFGSLSFFKPENAPPGATPRCTDGCPAAKSCMFNAIRIYLDLKPFYDTGKHAHLRIIRFFARHPKLIKALSYVLFPLKRLTDYKEWPVSVVTSDFSKEGKLKALREGPYGRCVFQCDNNVVDHQQTLIEFENGATAELTMHGHSALEGRSVRIDGTKGTLIGTFLFTGDDLVFFESKTGNKKRLLKPRIRFEAHGGGDMTLTEGFVNSLQPGFEQLPLTDARAALESHVMAFAAEKARMEHRVIDIDEFQKKFE